MPLHLFEKYGVELEYIIADQQSLDVLPICDKVLQAVAGEPVSEVERGELAWSNELVLHVIELKTNGPFTPLAKLPALFQRDVQQVNDHLQKLGGCLLPGGMHPWMNPFTETRLWPHEYTEVYRSYDRIFGCQGHGWSNLQSTHINLPFAGDKEFGRLHAAVRLVLPILPALAASSPIMDSRVTSTLDNRLEVYRLNQRKVPEIAGEVIPEPVFTAADYEKEILQKTYRAIQPLDPEGILQHEWLNSRGAIARFARGSIEIRVLDIQECPLADLAIVTLIVEVLQALVAEKWTSLAEQQAWQVVPLADIFLRTVQDAETALIDDTHYLKMFGFPEARCQARDLWTFLFEGLLSSENDENSLFRQPLQNILEHGTLASRIRAAVGSSVTREHLKEVYSALSRCLQNGEMFVS